MKKIKVLFLESRKKVNKSVPIDLSNLRQSLNTVLLTEKNIFLAYTIQYEHLAKALKSFLEAQNIKVKGFQQVLGCTRLVSDYPLILIGSGKFHALNLALQNKQVYVFEENQIINITQDCKKELEILKLKQKNNLNRFLNSINIGILITTKPGQNNSPLAKKLKQKIEKNYPKKKVYLFVSNNINFAELENFQINLWINTACPGLINDSNKIINAEDIFSFLENLNKK